MTFIHNPGLGELADRLSIVSRKIVEDCPTGATSARPRLEQEAEVLADKIVELFVNNTYTIQETFMLAAVNAAIWEREDMIRREPPSSETFERNMQNYAEIAKLNDRRRKLIAELSGVDADPKIYK